MSSPVRGWHIAFLVLAVGLLSVPLSRWVVAALGESGPFIAVVDRMFVVMIGVLIVGCVTPLRKRAIELLAIPIGTPGHAETVMACAFKMVLIFGYSGGLAAWVFVSLGPESVVRMISGMRPVEDEWAIALSMAGILTSVALGGLVAPIVEEIVFRGFLQETWERRWGWLAAVMMTSTVFALFHKHPISAFAGGVLFSCVYRRTGSLRAAIACHMYGNLVLWYPLLGQFLMPSRDRALADPAAWWLQLSCLALALVALPLYVFVAATRPAEDVADTELLRQPA